MDKENSSKVENMKISLLDFEGNNICMELKKQDMGLEINWIGIEENYICKIVTDKDVKEVIKIEKSENIYGTNEEIRRKFLEAFFEYKMNICNYSEPPIRK